MKKRKQLGIDYKSLEWFDQWSAVESGKAVWGDFTFRERTVKGWLIPYLFQIDRVPHRRGDEPGENVLGKAARLKKMRKEAKEQTRGLGKGYASTGKAGTIFTCPERRAYQVLKGRRQHFDPLKACKGIKLGAANIMKMPFEIADNTSRKRLIKKAKAERERKRKEKNDERLQV